MGRLQRRDSQSGFKGQKGNCQQKVEEWLEGTVGVFQAKDSAWKC